MKIEDKKIDGNLIHSNSFKNLWEMVNYIKEKEPYTDIWAMDSHRYNPSFSGVYSFDDALDLCLNGYKDNFEELKTYTYKLDTMLPFINNKRIVKSAVYGFRPNINKFMSGNPSSMYKLVRKEENGFVNMYFNSSCSSYTSRKAIEQKGIITISLIKFLEKQGIRVNLIFFSLSRIEEEYIFISVSLKEPSQLLDTSICNFPMCHPAFLRCICFAIKERVEVKYKYNWRDGYGKVCFQSDIQKILRPEPNSLILSDPNELNIYGRDIIEDTINFIETTGFNKALKNNQKLEFDEKQKKFILTR